MKPSQDLMFSIVSREAKYKTKNAVDTAVYRGGDFATAWLVSAVARLGMGVSSMALVWACVAAVWSATAWWAGKRYDEVRAGGASVSGADAEELADHAGDVARS